MRISKIWFLLPLLLSAALAQKASAENIIALDPLSYTVDENAGTVAVLIRVTRDGTPAEAISVDYATADGSANAGSDYSQTTGTATFAANETAKVIHIPIIDDLVESLTRSSPLPFPTARVERSIAETAPARLRSWITTGPRTRSKSSGTVIPRTRLAVQSSSW